MVRLNTGNKVWYEWSYKIFNSDKKLIKESKIHNKDGSQKCIYLWLFNIYLYTFSPKFTSISWLLLGIFWINVQSTFLISWLIKRLFFSRIVTPIIISTTPTIHESFTLSPFHKSIEAAWEMKIKIVVRVTPFRL